MDTPSEFPDDPAYDDAGAAWRETTSVYGPAFTLVTEVVALVSGSSAAAAAWIFKVLAASGVLACVALAARLARDKPYAAALVAGTRFSRSTSPAAATTTRFVIAFTLGALVLAAGSRGDSLGRPGRSPC